MIIDVQQKPAIDESRLATLNALVEPDDTDNFVSGLIDMFVDQTKAILVSLAQAKTQHDVDKTRHLAHRLKGICRNLGVERLSYICNCIETDPQGFALDGNQEILTQMKDEFEEARSILNENWR